MQINFQLRILITFYFVCRWWYWWIGIYEHDIIFVRCWRMNWISKHDFWFIIFLGVLFVHWVWWICFWEVLEKWRLQIEDYKTKSKRIAHTPADAWRISGDSAIDSVEETKIPCHRTPFNLFDSTSKNVTANNSSRFFSSICIYALMSSFPFDILITTT